jgi:hypothetical protein
MTELTLEYILLVCIATCGVLQLAASYSNLKGLLFFQTRILTYIFALLAIGGSFGWFFGWDDRLSERIMHTGIEGSQQFGYFLLAAFAGLVLTTLISSLVNSQSSNNPGEATGEGLDRLKNSNYIGAIRRSFGKESERKDSDGGS